VVREGSIAAGGYLLLLASSGPLVSGVLANIGSGTERPDTGGGNSENADPGRETEDAEETNSGDDGRSDDSDERIGDDPVTERERDVGQIIGKCENVLVLSFVLANAYTALAVVFAAKSIVRREDMVKNSKYYLAGTLVNFTYRYCSRSR
jgi:hypothetical protein